MKLKIAVLLGMACAGLGASYALAAKGGGPNHDNKPAGGPPCRHTHLHGMLAAPQTLTVTVAKGGKHSPFTQGDTVTVTLGTTGQTVDVNVEGCAPDASTLTANHAVLHVHPAPPAGNDAKHGHGHDNTTTTDSSTDTTTSP